MTLEELRDWVTARIASVPKTMVGDETSDYFAGIETAYTDVLCKLNTEISKEGHHEEDNQKL